MSAIVLAMVGVPAVVEHATTAVAAAMSPTDPTRVPHYFGPFPNWANSPQVTQNAVVTVAPPTNAGGSAVLGGVTAEASATVDPKTGAIAGIDVTVPGSGYTAPPAVTITAPGAHQTPFVDATAAALISEGALRSIAVDSSGFGFTAPVVTISGGNPTTPATAVASGGVDDLTLVDGGSGYQNQPIVEISLPDVPTGRQATGTAVMDATGVVTSVAVVDAGSGYTKAPTVRVLDANADNPTAATVVATIGVAAIDITAAGAGFTTAPTVDIADSGTGTGGGAFATASVAVLGAVTNIVVTTPGSGYLTPGLRKFVDTLPGLTPTGANDLGNYIPVGVADTTTYPGTDYYEIGVVQYTHTFHKDLPPTLLRGYVQLSTSVVPGKRVRLVNENVGLDPNADVPVSLADGTPVYGVDSPSYLGPTIVATKDRPVRILFRNLLPTGEGGDLFLPVDTTLMGAGPGKNAMMLDASGVPMDMATNDGTVTDQVRNPVCGETPKPSTCFTENRATLHLHGGITPWISDGTPHQWVTPAGEITDYPAGVSVTNVPDMADPGPGAETFFYTNQQSARLMFYHDHAWGITRLNVYAGEAAGYMITDATEQRLFGQGGTFSDLGLGTPLIIQDKTFVPSDDQIAKVDPTWQKAKWGGEGSLWTPHVYMPAQNPSDPTGMSAFGRWMYGPWFWPPAKNAKYPPIANPYYDPSCDPATAPDNFCEPAQIPGTPNVTVGMEAFNDTPVVNGTAYPATKVDPKSYRFRILNAANDRFWNLQWYVADPTTGTLSEVALKPAEVAAAQTDPNVFPTPDTSKSPAGPDWIQIGTEGGFLPTPTIVPAQPTTWITDPTRFDVGNVDKHSLLLAPAERADVIVDFSQYRGKTLILYNDAPAAFPARVSSYDYYTGGPDLSPVGAPTTLPGYGPNTRTVMKVTVSSAPPAARFDVPNTDSDRFGALKAAFAHHADGSGVFEQGQHPLIVGQAAYNTALGTSFVANGWCNSTVNPSAKCDGYARIQEQGGDPFKFDTVDPNAQASAVVDAASTGVDVATYTGQGVLHVAATSGFGKSGKITVATSTGTAVLSYSGVDVQRDSAGQQRELSFTGVRLVSGSGVLATGGVITGPKGQLAIPLEAKGIHDEMNSASFDEYGRMTANMGLEAPGATPLLQNIILYPYVNPSTELLDSSRLPDGVSVTPISSASDGTQIWKITHNGVDTHPIHFHLFDVQVINRVTWDNIIIPPDPNELGWKDTVRISPLEDTLVAVRPIIPRLPFAIPDSRRPLNPMMPVGAKGDLNGAINGQEAGFNNTDTAGAPMATPIVNEVVNNGWEYVYHCHILSHEEMDMMRPVNVHVSWSPPSAPTALTYDQGTLRWTDGTPYSTSPAAWDMHHSEIGFRIERAPVPAKGSPAFEVVGDAIANAESFVDSTANPGTSYVYRVTAWNEGGQTSSDTVQVTAPAQPPTNLTVTLQAGPSVQLDWAMPADPTITSVVVEREDGVGTFVQKAVLVADATTWTDTTVVGGLYTYRVHTTNAGGSSAFAGPVSVSIHASTTSLTSVANPSTFGSLATFTATVAGVPPTTPPTGTVTFSVNSVPAQTVALVNGSATFFTSTLAVGSSVITADYSGDADFVASTGSVTQVVNKASSSVSLASDAPVAPGLGDVTLTANVVPGSATGTVTFTVDRGLPSVVTRTVAMVGSSATWTVSTLVVGTHTVDATYSGNGSYLPSTSPSITQTIVAIPTTVSVTSSQNPSRNGQLVTFNAAVTAASGTATPSGSVKFRITTAGAADTVAVVALGASGRASFTTGALSIGSHAVTVSYGTTLPWASSVSSTLTQMVDRSASSVLLQSSVNPSVFGQTVTFTADMNSTAATGTVTFVIDGTTSYAATVDSNGRARLALATLAVGNHTVVANYSGSPLYSPSSSATITQTVQKASTAVSLRTSGSPANRGTRVTFTATVTAVAPGVGAPTGIIRFTIDGRIYDVAVRQGGIATYWTRLLAVGTHQVTATYMGNANFNVSTRAVISQRIR